MRELRPFLDCIWYGDPKYRPRRMCWCPLCAFRNRSASAVVRNDNAATTVAL